MEKERFNEILNGNLGLQALNRRLTTPAATAAPAAQAAPAAPEDLGVVNRPDANRNSFACMVKLLKASMFVGAIAHIHACLPEFIDGGSNIINIRETVKEVGNVVLDNECRDLRPIFNEFLDTKPGDHPLDPKFTPEMKNALEGSEVVRKVFHLAETARAVNAALHYNKQIAIRALNRVPERASVGNVFIDFVVNGAIFGSPDSVNLESLGSMIPKFSIDGTVNKYKPYFNSNYIDHATIVRRDKPHIEYSGRGHCRQNLGSCLNDASTCYALMQIIPAMRAEHSGLFTSSQEMELDELRNRATIGEAKECSPMFEQMLKIVIKTTESVLDPCREVILENGGIRLLHPTKNTSDFIPFSGSTTPHNDFWLRRGVSDILTVLKVVFDNTMPGEDRSLLDLVKHFAAQTPGGIALLNKTSLTNPNNTEMTKVHAAQDEILLTSKATAITLYTLFGLLGSMVLTGSGIIKLIWSRWPNRRVT